MIAPRQAVATLVVSATLLVGIAQHEGYVEVAAPPVAGDVPTNGFGTTTHADGTPLRAGEQTTPERALVRLLDETNRQAASVKRCAPVPMHQREFDAFVSLTYNIGAAAFCSSTLAKKLKAGDYPGACAEILRWDRFGGQPLPGLTKRRRAEFRRCMGETPAAAPSPDRGALDAHAGRGRPA